MARKHEERTLARRMAVQALYKSEITGEGLEEVASTDTIIPDDGALLDYTVTLLSAVRQHIDEVDRLISDASKNWALSRMPIVDRAILRCAVAEMLYFDDVPCAVSINEAVELAKEFGGEDESPSFVNGVLGRISRSGAAGGTPDPCAEGGVGSNSPEMSEASVCDADEVNADE